MLPPFTCSFASPIVYGRLRFFSRLRVVSRLVVSWPPIIGNVDDIFPIQGSYFSTISNAIPVGTSPPIVSVKPDDPYTSRKITFAVDDSPGRPTSTSLRTDAVMKIIASRYRSSSVAATAVVANWDLHQCYAPRRGAARGACS